MNPLTPNNPEAAWLTPDMMAPNVSRIRKKIPLRRIVRLLALGACWGLTLGGGRTRAESLEAPEYDLKAGYIAKFPDFVKWPAGAGAVTVGVLGEDPFGASLDAVIKVKRSKRLDDLKGCQIIFISKSERGNVPGIVAALAGTGIMTVSDMEGFVKMGGVLGFVTDGGKVRFEINQAAAKRAGVEISSRLLKLAIRVGNW